MLPVRSPTRGTKEHRDRPKGGLGRGLAALIPTGPQTDVVANVFMGGSASRIPGQADGAVSGDDPRSGSGIDSADSEAERSPPVNQATSNNEGDDRANAAPNGSPTNAANGRRPRPAVSSTSIRAANGQPSEQTERPQHTCARAWF